MLGPLSYGNEARITNKVAADKSGLVAAMHLLEAPFYDGYKSACHVRAADEPDEAAASTEQPLKRRRRARARRARQAGRPAARARGRCHALSGTPRTEFGRAVQCVWRFSQRDRIPSARFTSKPHCEKKACRSPKPCVVLPGGNSVAP